MTPTWRKPFGVLAILLMIAVYALVVIQFAEAIGRLPILVQAPIYLVLGIAWILPMRPMLLWMETGRWTPPSE